MLTLTSRTVAHGIPAFALGVKAGGASLTYSGDTAPCPGLTELAAGCDVLPCEAGSARAAAGEERDHHTPDDAAQTAATAGAARLIVTHVDRSLSPQQAVNRAAARFGGSAEYAMPGATFEIG